MRGTSILLAAAAALSLAACQGSSGSSGSSGSGTTVAGAAGTGASATSAAPTSAAPTTASPTTAAPTTPAPTTAVPTTAATTAPAASGASCPVGSWHADAAQIYESLRPALSTAGVNFTASGGLQIDFQADGTVRFIYQDMQLNISSGGTGHFNGPVTGRYTVTGNSIQASNVTSQVAGSINVSGITIDAGPLMASFLQSLPINASTFQCNGSTLVLTITGGPANGVRETWTRV